MTYFSDTNKISINGKFAKNNTKFDAFNGIKPKYHKYNPYTQHKISTLIYKNEESKEVDFDRLYNKIMIITVFV